MKLNKKLLLILILILAAVLRFYKLDEFPALNADEAALGYNAYSLLETGKDEHGNPWPIHFQSFNDYKPGLTVYLILPFVKIFGLNIFWIRFLPALIGVATVPFVYLLANEIFDKSKLSVIRFPLSVGLIASFLLAINPWHIHFSRGAWEVNVATFLMTSGVYFFLKALKKPNFLNFSLFIFSFSLSMYAYHSARLISPLLGLGLLLVYWKTIRNKQKQFIKALTLGFLITTPLIISLLSGNILSRASGVGLLADRGPIDRINEQRGQHNNIDDFSAVALHNKVINYGLAFLENWGEHYSGEFLFLSGDDIQRNKVPETGQMYLFDILLIPLGIVFLLKNSFKNGLFILWWLLIAPVAAALTFQSPHALRAQIMVIPLVVLSAFGLYYLLDILKKHITSTSLISVSYLLLATIIVWNFTRYQHMYWRHMSKEYPFSSQYGVELLVDYIKVNKTDGQKVIVTDRYDQPYILFLFYLNYPPDKFQQEHNLTSRDDFGFSTVREFGDYSFRPIDYEEFRVQYPNTMLVGTDEEIPDWANITKEIYGSNGYKYFDVVAN